MNQDIVDRLRALAAQMSIYGSKRATMLEAANEIQRLRDGILRYVTTISDCYCTFAMERDALELLKEVWRGD